MIDSLSAQLYNARDASGQIIRQCGISNLVVHDPEVTLIFQAFSHEIDEISPHSGFRTIQNLGADDRMAQG